MTGRRITAVLAASCLALGASAAVAQERQFGSPLLRAPGTVAETVACYFSNTGDKAVPLSRARIFRQNGSGAELSGDTCGAPSFQLAPGRTCYITAWGSPDRLGCKAATNPRGAAQLRGSVELRDAAGKVLVSDRLTASDGGQTDDAFEQIASPTAHGGPNQVFAECRLVNLGREDVTVKKLQFVTTDGAIVTGFGLLSECGNKKSFKLRGGRSCAITMNYASAAGELRCRAFVTRKEAVRGAMKVYSAAYEEELNSHSME